MRALVDRPLTAAIAERLRAGGIDAVWAGERADLAGLGDEELLARAGEEGRVLVTQNVGDHLPLAEAAAGRHPGVVMVSPVRYPRGPLGVDQVVLALDAYLSSGDPEELAARGVHWLEPPPGCPFWPRG